MNILKFIYSDKVIGRWLKTQLPDKYDVISGVAANSGIVTKDLKKYSPVNDATCEFYARKFLNTAQHEPETDGEARLARVKKIAKVIKRFCRVFAVDLIESKDDSPLGLANHYDSDQKSSAALLWSFLHYYCANSEDTNIRRLYFDPQSRLVLGNSEDGTARSDFDIAVYLLVRVTKLNSGLDVNILSSLYRKIVKSEYSLELSLWDDSMVDDYLKSINQLFHLAGKFGNKEAFHQKFPEISIEDLRFKTRNLYLDMSTSTDTMTEKISSLDLSFGDSSPMKGLLKRQEMYGPVPSWVGLTLPDKTAAISSNEVTLYGYEKSEKDGPSTFDLILDTKQYAYNESQNYSKLDVPWIVCFNLIKLMVNPLAMSGLVYLSSDFKVKTQGFGNAAEIEWASKVPPSYTHCVEEMQTPIWTSMRNEVSFPVSWDRVHRRIIVQFKSKTFASFSFVREIKNALPDKISFFLSRGNDKGLELVKIKDENSTVLTYKEET